jgi:hypothetical protein
MIIIRKEKHINLNELSEMLGFMRIEELNIFCINNKLSSNNITYASSKVNSDIKYAEMNSKNFVKFLNREDNNFLEYNKYSLYILRKGNYLKIKNLFSSINNTKVNLGRGGGQKSHGLSPLDFRLSSYLMAIFNFDYKYITYLNTFNEMSKKKYLSYKDMLKNL